MSIRSSHALLLGSSTIALLLASGDDARPQESLPTVEVTAPSPIRRPARRPARPAPAAPTRTAAPAPAPAPPPTPPEVTWAGWQGTLPVVVDQFATVTVVGNDEIRRGSNATLGDLLQNKPGITGSSFAPGVSSRPIIRGLDVNRVGIVQDGIGANGASDLGEDHFVPVSPLTSNQIEVIRGPATLRYGSQAIGGVVSSTDNRIPDRYPSCFDVGPAAYAATGRAVPRSGASGPDGRPCVNFESRTAATTVDAGLEGAALLDAGGNNFAMHADAFERKSSDYRIPSYPYLFVPGRPFNGKQPNSYARVSGESLGGSYIFDGGFIGAAIVHDNAHYGIPTIDGVDTGTRIVGEQTKFISKGEWRSPSPIIDAVRFWAGITDYKHNEIGLGDPADPFSDGIQQTFTNKEQEVRVETQLMPFNLRFAELTTALGVQASHQDLNAPGADPGPFSGLFDPNSNRKIAGYIFNEFKFSETWKAQVAGRIENVDLKGSVPNLFDPLVSDIPIARNPNFTPKSISFGVIHNMPWDLVASLTAQYVERAPKPAELFSRGPHDATGTFDVGDPNLKIEVAKSIEAGLRRATGPFRFEATAYATRFDGFIYRALTGETCAETPDTCMGAPFGGAGGDLNQAFYSQKDANFRGAEIQFQYDVMPLWNGVWGVEGQYDIVRATFTDGTNVPRIPPQRLGGGLYWRDPNWLVKVFLLHAYAQNDIAPIAETPTAGYNRLRAEISYKEKLKKPNEFGISELNVGLVGDNLLNEDIRNAVSYTKDQVLLPGASVRLFSNVKW
jgi:iron complex outermembrane receptor protein